MGDAIFQSTIVLVDVQEHPTANESSSTCIIFSPLLSPLARTDHRPSVTVLQSQAASCRRVRLPFLHRAKLSPPSPPFAVALNSHDGISLSDLAINSIYSRRWRRSWANVFSDDNSSGDVHENYLPDATSSWARYSVYQQR
jgi:hypothetical protein